MSQELTTSVNVGFSVDGLSIGGGASSTSGTSVTDSKTITYQIPPGRQAVYVAGIAYTSETGNVQVNYGSRVDGHFIVST